MTYRVEIETSAARALAKIDKADQQRIAKRITALADDPRPHGAEKLTGVDAWRIRIGNYRVVYAIDDALWIVTVTRIAHRREVYRGI